MCTNIDPITLAFAEETIPDAALELILSAAVNLDEDDSAECLAVVRHPDGERLIVFDDASGHVSIALQLDFIGAASRPGNDADLAESRDLWNGFQQKIRGAVPNSSQADSDENGLVPILRTQNLDSEARLRIIQSLQLIRLPYNSSPSLFIQFPAQEFARDKPESVFRVYTNLRLSFDLEIRQSEWPVAERYYFNGFEFVSCTPTTVCAALTDLSMQMSDSNDWEMRFEFRRLFDDEAMQSSDMAPKVVLEFPAGGSAQLDRRRPGLDISTQPRVQYALPPECALKAC
ncbi:MAG: hypothetical protein KDK34_09700, partial [Leptospiraceae bacterium]|nr:hypothetical protein [Leptospiraceae bacterium]